MTTNKKPKVLFYDIETVLLMFYAFSPGKQYLNHKQLVPGKSRNGIICITYCWETGPVKILKWTAEGGLNQLIKDFDELVKQADFTIGKNSDRFDSKMINGCRIFTDQPGMPAWTKYTDDLEKQMRKYLRLPSQSLDYISGQLGLGGKVKMDFSDWADIDAYMSIESLSYMGMGADALEIYCQYMFRKSLKDAHRDGLRAFNKMCFYGKKDTKDTRKLWFKLSEHFDTKWNQARWQGVDLACKYMDCGSTQLYINKTRMGKWVEYHCSTCKRYAGRVTTKKIM